MSESKTHTIRASEETIASFKTLCSEFANADEAVQALIAAHEMSQAKGMLSGQETNVNDFQSHIDSLMRAYISSLDLTANTENRVHGEYRERLESKDKTIIELQDILGDSIKEINSAFSDDEARMEAFNKAEYTAKIAKQMVNAADVVLRADKLCGSHDRIDYMVGTLEH